MSHFSKHHYEAIATAMQAAKPAPRMEPDMMHQWEVTLSHLCDMFARDNGLFQHDRFIRACEPGANVRARTK